MPGEKVSKSSSFGGYARQIWLLGYVCNVAWAGFLTPAALREEAQMMRSTMLLLAAMVAAMLLASGVALAATVINCADDPVAPCDGTTGDDEMTGTSETDDIYAKEGNDTLRGLEKIDDLRGGPGNDNLDGGGGNDTYSFYEDDWGVDRISGDSSGTQDSLVIGSATAGALVIDLVPSPHRVEVSSGRNRINFAPKVVIERVQSGLGSDTIKGNSADNYLQGRDLNDRLMGRGGDDTLFGDTAVLSDQGNDTLIGGPGRDILNGGPGHDIFLAQDGEADEIICGPGGDVVVNADPSLDSQSPDCNDFIGPLDRQ
jgi:hemolysin type calcium-binding protein